MGWVGRMRNDKDKDKDKDKDMNENKTGKKSHRRPLLFPLHT